VLSTWKGKKPPVAIGFLTSERRIPKNEEHHIDYDKTCCGY
jgi:uncharacterized protein (DUF169 family)